jgi:hypothetical protein
MGKGVMSPQLDESFVNHKAFREPALESEKITDNPQHIHIIGHVMKDGNEELKLEICLLGRDARLGLMGPRGSLGRLAT